MNPQLDSASGLGLPQPGSDTSQLPPIHTPETFHAPDSVAHFATSSVPVPAVAPPAAVAQPQAAPTPPPIPDPLAAIQGQITTPTEAPAEDVDDDFDAAWVVKAKDIVGRTHADPYLQSRELSKLKAQYIKARYNKDIKVSED